MTHTVAFIGLGIMGAPMALNLRKAGHMVRVHARRPEAMTSCAQAGCSTHATAADAASGAEVIFIMVSDTHDVQHVLFAESGIAQGAKPGAVVVDMSTISPTATKRFAAQLLERGVEMLDAPVSGGDVGAINGTLSIMVGGKPEIFARVKPLFECMGKNIVYIGDHGAGQVAKACNQIVVGVTIEAVAEALTFARKSGVDPAKVREALLGGFAASRILEVHGKRMLDNNYQPGFKTKLHQKDLNIVLQTAHEMGLALPAAALVAQHLNSLMGLGDAELDSAAMMKIIERMSGVERE